MMENAWINTKFALPPEGQLVETKIDDQHGIRNEQDGVLIKNLWYGKRELMYWYYTPTHWRNKI